jgi:hypothetical protein
MSVGKKEELERINKELIKSAGEGGIGKERKRQIK